MVIETRYLKFKVETNIQVEQRFRGKSERMRKKKKERKSIWKSKTQLWVLRTWLMWMGMCAYASSAHALPHILLQATLSINLVGSGFILTISLSLNATLDQILFSENTLYVSYANEMNWLTFHFFFLLIFLHSISWLIASFFSKRISMSNLV